MVNIKVVAKEAGVSISTVSRVVNGNTSVREDLRNKVLEVVEKTGYRSNFLARGLKGLPTRTIGLVIPDIENPFFPAMVRGVQDVANRNGYAIFLCNTDGDMKLEEGQYNLLLEKKVDGILLVSSSQDIPFLEIASSIPIVLLDRYTQSSNFSYVVVDHTYGINIAIKHLRNIGRLRIAFIGSKPITSGARERFQAFLVNHQRDPNLKSRILFGKYTQESGAEMAEKLLNSGEKFDSIVCGNDLIAYGVIDVLQNHGIKIPEDVSVVGYDDIPSSAYRSPKLTTIHQPIYELGQIGAHMMIDAIEKGLNETKHIKLEPYLIVRETSVPRGVKSANN